MPSRDSAHPAVLAALAAATGLAGAACGSSGTAGDAPRSAVPPALSAAPPAPADSAPPAAEGALFVAVRGVGVVRLDGVTSTVVFPTKETLLDMAIQPSGTLWATYYEEGTVRLRSGKAEKITPDRYQHFAFRAEDDVWAVTDDIEWQVAHFDGKAFTKVRKRADFPGKYDDNKLNDFTVTSDAVWVSSWNGLSRLAGASWEPVALPGDTARQAPSELVGFGKTLLARHGDGWFAWNAGTWRAAPWPSAASIDAVNEAGLAAGSAYDTHRIVVGTPAAGTPSRTVDPVAVGDITGLAVDLSGRVWVGGDYALSVLDPNGKVLATWEPGTLAGVTGAIERIAVSGRGPAELPAKQATSRWDLTGQVTIYKSSAPAPSVKVTLCPTPRTSGCPGAPFSRSATTAADGSFRLKDVPPGDFWLNLEVPPDTPGCGGIFYESPGGHVSIEKECHVAEGAPRVCAIPPMRACLPFEMPPPH